VSLRLDRVTSHQHRMVVVRPDLEHATPSHDDGGDDGVGDGSHSRHEDGDENLLLSFFQVVLVVI
jgi:hypothetical protein